MTAAHSVAFYEESETGEGDNFSVSEAGNVVVRKIDTAGSYAAVIAATSGFFTGVARFTLSVQVNATTALLFNGINVAAAGIIGIDNIQEHEDAAERRMLARVSMAYHGERRGLHWIRGVKYYSTSQQVASDRHDDGLTGTGNRDDWYSNAICAEGGGKWRLPTLIELAGAMLGDSKTEAIVRVSGAKVGTGLSMFEIKGGGATGEVLTLSVPKIGSDDAATLSSEKDLGNFAGVFNAAEKNTEKGIQAHVFYDSVTGEFLVGEAETRGRVVCVYETDNYEETARWAELSVMHDGGPRSSRVFALTLSAADERAAANMTVGLGLFTLRGATEPEPVPATLVIKNVSVELQNNYGAFTVSLVTVIGGFALEASVPSAAASILYSGIYTLSIRLAPAGKYIGFAQREFSGNLDNSYDSSEEGQFDLIRLAVDWTRPAQEVDEFTFAGVTVSTTEGKAKITAGVQNLANFQIYNDIEMEYFGDVGELRVMFSRDSDTSSSGAQLFPDSSYFNNDSLCSAGGDDWRSPTLSELGMIITPAGDTSMNLTVNDSIPGALSASRSDQEVLDLNFADADGGLHRLAYSFGAEFSTEMRVISGLVGNSVLGFGFIQRRGENTDASLEVNHGKNMIAVCVEEIKDTYDASANPQLAGVTVSTNLSTGITAPNGTAATGKHTIAAQAYYYSSVDESSFEVSAAFLDGEPLMVKFGDLEDDGPFVLKGSDGTTDVKDQTITDGVIVIDFGASKIEEGNTDLEIVVKPPLGEERTLTVEFKIPPVTVAATDNGALSSDNQVTAEMEHYGDVGGLRVMFSRNLIEGPASLGPRLCEGVGGTGWRNPTLSELGMLLTGPSVTVLTLTVGDGGGEASSGPSKDVGLGTPGNANTFEKVVTMTFPVATDAKGGMVAALRNDGFGENFFGSGDKGNEFRVISGLFDNGAAPLMFVYNNTSAGQAALEDYTDHAVAVCVKEIDNVYDAADHNQLAGVRHVGVSLSVSFMTLTVTENLTYGDQTPFFTITAQAYFFPDANTDEEVVVETLLSAALSVDFGDSTNDSGFYDLSSSVNSAGDTVIVVTGKTGKTAPTDAAAKNLEIQVTPPLGAPVILNVEFMNLN